MLKQQALDMRKEGCTYKDNTDRLIEIGYKAWRKSRRKSNSLTQEEQDERVRKIEEGRNRIASKEALTNGT